MTFPLLSFFDITFVYFALFTVHSFYENNANVTFDSQLSWISPVASIFLLLIYALTGAYKSISFYV